MRTRHLVLGLVGAGFIPHFNAQAIAAVNSAGLTGAYDLHRNT